MLCYSIKLFDILGVILLVSRHMLQLLPGQRKYVLNQNIKGALFCQHIQKYDFASFYTPTKNEYILTLVRL